MQKKFRLTLAVGLMFACVCVAGQQSAVAPLPLTPKQPVVDEYHGVKVTDNYRWFEDGKNPQVIAWTQAEDRHARALLDPLPLHTEIQQYLKKLLNQRSPSFYELAECHGRLFAMNSQPGQQQDTLVTLRSPDDLASKHIVVDPNQIDPTHSTAIQFYVPSIDGGKVAVSLASGGTESGTLHIYDVATGIALPDVVPRVSVGGGSVAWSADGSGLYYTHYPHQGERPLADLSFYEQVYYHKLGTPATEDSYIIGKDFPRVAEISLTTNDDGRYLLVMVANGDGGTYEHLLRDPTGQWTRLTQFSDQVTAAVFGGDGLYMLSRNRAPRGKLVRVSLTNPDLAMAQTVIPETSAVLQDFRFSLSVSTPSYAITRTRLYVVELVGGPTEIHIFDHDGRALGTVPAEPVSTVDQIVPLTDDNILFANVSWVDPRAWYVFDATSYKTTVSAMRETSTESFADVEAVREFAISKDGTRVPVNIIRRRGTKLDGKNPTVLRGYGGFDISLSPRFYPTVHAWLDAGGVFAIANLRGGGEFGEQWHKAGMLTHKQNVFDDFIASAELLIKDGYTTPSKLGIEGGSNGGLLIGAVLTQRPDLCRAAVSVAGVYDMLRYETTENGQFNVPEYGSIKDPEQFQTLYAYSPYHHVKNGTKYPSVLFLVGENDPRVNPWHSRKMIARLQAANASCNPILLVSFSNAGHGGIGSAEDQHVAMDTYHFEFMYQQLGVKWVSPVERAK